jgi:hypothetical protein
VNHPISGDDDKSALLTGQAALLSWPTDPANPVRTRRDKDNTNHPAGNYIMSVYCAGSGHAVAILRIGSLLDTSVMDCNPAPQTTKLSVSGSGENSEVVITALDGGTIAVSYQLSRTS